MPSRKKDECRCGAIAFFDPGGGYRLEWSGSFAENLLKSLRDYKSGARKNPIMGGQVGSLNSQDMADIAAFYSRQKGSLHVIR